MINSEEIDSFKSNISELLNVVLYEVCQNLQLNLRLESRDSCELELQPLLSVVSQPGLSQIFH